MHAVQFDGDSRKLGELPGSSDTSKVEVWSHADAHGATELELVECSWATGLGWYVQRRLSLDAAQVEALRLLLPAVAEPQACPWKPRLRVPSGPSEPAARVTLQLV